MNNAIATLFAERVLANKIKLQDVPAKLQKQVQEILISG